MNHALTKSLQLIDLGLANQKITRAFNSIGSNIFFEFGKDIEITFPNGKKDTRKEWVIWIGDASWRIVNHNKYVIGSGDRIIQSKIQILKGKRFQFFQALSQFFDIEFNFEDGYQLSTFFNGLLEDQWTLFLPNQTEIFIDCSNKNKIHKVMDITNHLSIKNYFQPIEPSLNDIKVTNIIYDELDLRTIQCENDISIKLERCTWRLEKDNEYLVGYLDENKENIKNEFSRIIGKKIHRIDVANTMMDARFQFEDLYVLKTFTCCRKVTQWKITSKTDILFQADISLAKI